MTISTWVTTMMYLRKITHLMEGAIIEKDGDGSTLSDPESKDYSGEWSCIEQEGQNAKNDLIWGECFQSLELLTCAE